MDWQALFNIAIVVIGFLGSWILNNLASKLTQVTRDHDLLKDEIHAVHILVAGNYVRNEALEKFSNAIFAKLDRIEEKLSNKQDKE